MRVRWMSLLVLVLAWAGSPARAAPESYRLDPEHTNVLFAIDHLGFSRMTGEVTGVTGRFRFDEDAVEQSSLEVELDPATVRTKSDALNQLLRGEDWLDVARHPRITFRSTRIERTGPATGRVTGDLTFRGVTQPVTLDVTFNKRAMFLVDGKMRAGFSATATLRRSAFGMTIYQGQVGDEVVLTIEAEGVREPGPTPGRGPR